MQYRIESFALLNNEQSKNKKIQHKYIEQI